MGRKSRLQEGELRRRKNGQGTARASKGVSGPRWKGLCAERPETRAQAGGGAPGVSARPTPTPTLFILSICPVPRPFILGTPHCSL